MKPQQLVMLVVAIGCGLAAMVMTQKMLANDGQEKVETTKVPVVVAATTITQGTRLDAAMLKVAQFEPDNVPDGAIATPADLIGRAARFQITANEVVTDGKLAAAGVEGGIEAVIEDGKRAMTVGITTDRAVAGFVKPGAHVDLMMRVRRSGPTQPARVVTILEAVKVIAINSSMQDTVENDTQGQRMDMVTFLVTPEEAEALTLAQGEGTLHIALRSGNDREEANRKGIDFDQLMSGRIGKNRQYQEAPEAVIAENNTQGLGDMLAGFLAAPKPEETTTEAEAVAPPAPPVPVVQPKAQRKIVYRDLEGNPLMEVILDADSKIVEGLGDLAEEVDGGFATQPLTLTGASPKKS